MAESVDCLDQAVSALKRGRPDEARAVCVRILREPADQPKALRLLAMAENARGDSAAAVAAIRRAVGLVPGDPGLMLELAHCLAADDRVAEATAVLGRVVATPPGDPNLCNQVGELFARLGDHREAAAAFERALALAPDLDVARFNLGLLRIADGDARGAAELFRRVCRAQPERPEPWLQLGGALNALGQHEDAAAALESHLRLNPASVDGWIWLGAARQLQGLFQEAATAYRGAIRLDAGATDAHANLGRLLQAEGQSSDAESSLREALRIDPEHLQARAGLAALLDNAGRYDEALASVETQDGKFPPETAAIAARVLRHLGRHEAARQILETALAASSLTAEAEIQLRFSLGRVLDETGDYGGASRCFTAANRRARRRFGDAARSQVAALEDAVGRLQAAFNQPDLMRLPRSGCESERPLFIVGLPRAGKSLAEQVLCAHREVHGAGELTTIPDLANELGLALGGWPDGVARVTEDHLADAATRYLAVLEAADPDAARVTDTMPFNFLNLGLIELLFPRARVVHCVRQPADLALRCFAKNFAGRSLAFTTDLPDIARYHAAYRRLMAHWHRTSALSIFVLRYEDLVRRPEATTRTLVAFAGLDWDQRCLRFFEDGVATSASDTPVRQPLDDSEVDAWRDYAGLLENVLPLLEPEA